MVSAVGTVHLLVSAVFPWALWWTIRRICSPHCTNLASAHSSIISTAVQMRRASAAFMGPQMGSAAVASVSVAVPV